MELFVHTQGKEHPDILEVEETAVIRTLLAGEKDDGHVWVEEAEGELGLEVTLVATSTGTLGRLD